MSSKRQHRLLTLIQMRDRGTTSTELAQKWQQAGVSASACTERQRLLEDGLVSRRAAKKPLLSRKNIRDRLIFCKRYRDWTAEDWDKVIFSDESPFRLFGVCIRTSVCPDTYPKQSERGFIRENDFTPVLSIPIPVLFAEYQSVPDVFPGEKWHLCCPS